MKTQANHPAFTKGADSWIQEGLTKREYFAAMAMQGLLSAYYGNELYPTRFANDSVDMADALITALNENQ
jgi:hypothetical protein